MRPSRMHKHNHRPHRTQPQPQKILLRHMQETQPTPPPATHHKATNPATRQHRPNMQSRRMRPRNPRPTPTTNPQTKTQTILLPNVQGIQQTPPPPQPHTKRLPQRRQRPVVPQRKTCHGVGPVRNQPRRLPHPQTTNRDLLRGRPHQTNRKRSPGRLPPIRRPDRPTRPPRMCRRPTTMLQPPTPATCHNTSQHGRNAHPYRLPNPHKNTRKPVDRARSPSRTFPLFQYIGGVFRNYLGGPVF